MDAPVSRSRSWHFTERKPLPYRGPECCSQLLLIQIRAARVQAVPGAADPASADCTERDGAQDSRNYTSSTLLNLNSR
jgi:hypothetical protein